MPTTRIVDLPSLASIPGDGYIAVDSTLLGTGKIPAAALVGPRGDQGPRGANGADGANEIDPTTLTSGFAAGSVLMTNGTTVIAMTVEDFCVLIAPIIVYSPSLDASDARNSQYWFLTPMLW